MIKGTRLTVELILRECARGASFAEIIDSYPRLTEEDIRAALEYAADYLRQGALAAAE
ncbi:MAG: DUF433 domain-containing protein [Caulobacteraceae bacterium]|nr:DUF433 domain-containing protein [Caulobacteraceae bacterium]